MQDCYDCHLMSCLLQAVADMTGKEDLIAALRRTLLLRVAAQLGCNKMAVGTCATRMAVRTVAMSAKGSGYALPAALQFTDSRSVEQTHLMAYLTDIPNHVLHMLLGKVLSVLLYPQPRKCTVKMQSVFTRMLPLRKKAGVKAKD